MPLDPRQRELCDTAPGDFSDLSALFLNCTLKRSGRRSHTEGLLRLPGEIMEEVGVSVEMLRPVDYEIAPGVYPDMTEEGWERDDWPELVEKVLEADIQHLGYTVPPQADAGWIGEVGPGPSYLDEGSGGPENDFTNRNATFLAWNLLHLARMLKDAGGVPAHGNRKDRWDAGCDMGFPNPEHRR